MCQPLGLVGKREQVPLTYNPRPQIRAGLLGLSEMAIGPFRLPQPLAVPPLSELGPKL